MSIEERLTALEQQVAHLSRQLDRPGKEDWTKRVIGSFASRPEFDEVIRLGREFRQRQNQVPASLDPADEK
jgi:hypothetical protein